MDQTVSITQNDRTKKKFYGYGNTYRLHSDFEMQLSYYEYFVDTGTPGLVHLRYLYWLIEGFCEKIISAIIKHIGSNIYIIVILESNFCVTRLENRWWKNSIFNKKNNL